MWSIELVRVARTSLSSLSSGRACLDLKTGSVAFLLETQEEEVDEGGGGRREEGGAGVAKCTPPCT